MEADFLNASEHHALLLFVEIVPISPMSGTYGAGELNDLPVSEEIFESELAHELSLGTINDDNVWSPTDMVPVIQCHHILSGVGDEGADGSNAVGQLTLPDYLVLALLPFPFQPSFASCLFLGRLRE